MKLICDGLDLSDAVLKVSKALSVKAVNPALEGIKIDIELKSGDYPKIGNRPVYYLLLKTCSLTEDEFWKVANTPAQPILFTSSLDTKGDLA